MGKIENLALNRQGPPGDGLDGPFGGGRNIGVQRGGDELRNRRHNTSTDASASSANPTCSAYSKFAPRRDSEDVRLSHEEASAQMILPDPVEADSLNAAEEALGQGEINFEGSCILQFKVSLDDHTWDKLHDVAVACTNVDNRITMQLGRRVFSRSAKNGVEMKTLENHEVPVILRSVYAAGKLTIEGLNLENATIRATTSSYECITLKNVKHPQVSGGLQVCTWNVQLPSTFFEEVAIYALKTICIDNQDVSVYSSVVRIQDNTLKAVIRIGIPYLVLFIYFVRQLYFAIQLVEWSNLGLDSWKLACFVVVLSQLLPPWIDNVVRAWLEHVRLIIWAIYFSMQSLLFNQSPRKPRQEHEKTSLDGDSRESSDGANNNFEAGDKIPNGSANVATTGGLEHLTDAATAINGTLLEIKRELEDSDDDLWFQGVKAGKSDLEHKTDSEPTIGLDWQWQAQQEYKTRSGRMKLRKCGDDKKEDAPIKTWIPFDVVYGWKEKMWPTRDYLNIHSPFLIEIIVRLVPKLKCDANEESLQVYAGTLFHIRRELRDIGSKGVDAVLPESAQASEARVKQQLHVDLLLRFMEKELKDALKRYSAMEKGSYVSWDMLWAFLPPGIQVVYYCDITDEEVLGIVTEACYELRADRGPCLRINIEQWDYNCSTWKGSYNTSRRIMSFDGECGFTTLQTFPLRFQADPEKAEKEFLARGESFSYLSMKERNRFLNYNGLIYMLKGGCTMLQKEDATGRVMVDLASFQRMNPSYHMGSAEPPGEVLRDNKVELIDISSRDDRMYAPAMVYGFSFRLKKWGTFLVCGFSEIVFNDKAFAALVMAEPRKKLVETLVSHHVQRKNTATTGGSEQAQQAQQVDPIVSKGEGCIILCYGGPGTGKTLTAESLSEKLHAPLWSVSVSELGTDPQELETYLVKVLDIASTWGAILLLDEADVYLEKRTGFNLTRTAMSGIFLRNLEYYRGVLFLTSNRIVAFDDAFRSRISMILFYEISKDERRQIWEMILNRALHEELPKEVLARFSEEELNGRDIRNVVHRAMILAKENGHSLCEDDIQESLNDTIHSLKVLALNRKEIED